MSAQYYEYRRVSYGHDWFIEIRGLVPADQTEIDEILRTLQAKHGWPIARQVLVVGQNEEGYGSIGSNGVAAHKYYRDVVRVGPHRNDVIAPMKLNKDTLE